MCGFKKNKFRNIDNIKEKNNEINKGITLIALVII